MKPAIVELIEIITDRANYYNKLLEKDSGKDINLQIEGHLKEVEELQEIIIGLSLKEEVLPHPIKFGRWLLKNAQSNQDILGSADGLSWIHDSKEYNTDKLFEIFLKLQ